MAAISSGNHPKALWPGVAAFFGAKYDEHSEEFPMLVDVRDSTKSYEEFVETASFGLAPVKAEGASVSYDSHTQGVTARSTHVSYALGYVVTHEEQQDNQYTDVSFRRAELLAFSMRQTKENVVANKYNRGFNSSYTGADGVELLSTAHPTLSGNQSNELATAADLSEASLEDLIVQIMNATNSRGLKISLMPRRLIVPPALWFEANRILKSTLQNDSANNAVNVLKATNALPDGIAVNHYLTDADAWFVRTNAKQGLTLWNRERIPLRPDNDHDTMNLKAFSYERYSVFWGDWRTVYGSPGA